MKIGSYEAKTRLPELLRRVELGERVLITRHGRVVAELRRPSRRSDEEAAALAAPFETFRKGRKLGSTTIRELVEEGRTR